VVRGGRYARFVEPLLARTLKRHLRRSLARLKSLSSETARSVTCVLDREVETMRGMMIVLRAQLAA